MLATLDVEAHRRRKGQSVQIETPQKTVMVPKNLIGEHIAATRASLRARMENEIRGRFIDDANRVRPDTFPLVAANKMPDLETYGRFRDELGMPRVVAFYRRGVEESHLVTRESYNKLCELIAEARDEIEAAIDRFIKTGELEWQIRSSQDET
jgi:hypothetical protein